MKRPPRILLVALLAASAACTTEKEQPTTPLGPGIAGNSNVTAQRVADGVKITNASTARISYVVVNPGWLGLLASCRSVACPMVAAGASVVVPEAEIYGFSSGVPRLVVRYWPETTSVPDPIEIDVAM